jgi:hypothetical protein
MARRKREAAAKKIKEDQQVAGEPAAEAQDTAA